MNRDIEKANRWIIANRPEVRTLKRLGRDGVTSRSKQSSRTSYRNRDTYIPREFHVPDMEDKWIRPIIVEDRNGRGDPPPDPHWGDRITQTFTLDTGWNFISFYIIPEGDMLYVFDELIQMGILEVVSSFYPGEGSVYFDPAGLDFLNTLTELRPGYGFMVKISDPPGSGSTYSFSIEGNPVNQSMSIPLYQDWNLIGYFGEDGISPEEIFTDLIDAGVLVYVSSFTSAGGSVFFDPAGMDFLNTLNEMYIGVGYWVKVSFDPNQYPDGYIPFYYESTSCLADECIFVDPSGGEYYDSMGNLHPTFATIQQAIDSSNNNLITDIIIKPGTYVESVDSIAKSNYNLKGEGEVIWFNSSAEYGGQQFEVRQCSIDNGEGVEVFLTENISIDNITFISNSDALQYGTIKINGPMNFISITNCVIDQSNLMYDDFPYFDKKGVPNFAAMCNAGEYLIHMEDYAYVTGGMGIQLATPLLDANIDGLLPHEPFHKGGIRNVEIRDNVIQGCNLEGISVTPQGPYYGPEPSVADAIIERNDIVNNYFGFMNSPSFYGPPSAASDFSFIDNLFSNNCAGFQSFLQHSEWLENVFDGNRYGIYFPSAPTEGYALPNSEVFDNTFINHPGAHVLEYTEYWNLPEDDPYLISYDRNYWDDYTGEDQDGDGFGDTPYWVDTSDESERGFDPDPRMTMPENV